jgi:glutamate racemase
MPASRLIRRFGGGNLRRVNHLTSHVQFQPAPHALVFDSGVGGLSVLREIAALLPQLRLTYAADNAAFPYGLKTEEELVSRVSAVIRRLVDETAPDIVVIACNTASTTALDAVRRFLKVPVIGVVPAIKPAAAASRTGTIGLLGTNATVASSYTGALIERFAAGCAVLTCGAPELVEAAERKLQGYPVELEQVSSVLVRLFDQPGGDRLDVVVLGCTHFPLLGPELAAAAPHPVAWMDSGAAIARRVAALLGDNIDASELPTPPRHRAFFTARSRGLELMQAGLEQLDLGDVHVLEI